MQSDMELQLFGSSHALPTPISSLSHLRSRTIKPKYNFRTIWRIRIVLVLMFAAEMSRRRRRPCKVNKVSFGMRL